MRNSHARDFDTALLTPDYLADARRANPRQDLLSRLVEAEEEGVRLNEQELLGMCGFLIVAGHETTMALLANGLLALLRHPDQQHGLRDGPQQITTAVEARGANRHSSDPRAMAGDRTG